ncbi:MAG: response regulator [Confluentimicrobium sp.]|uniref:response regulator n=1 Tax=Actibacterium sp. TaxID=1872125 RepID=UPI000C674704|nr:response regulator [Actibacterium sp.]MBC56441.1 response regulator [Actibacterium sp.]|tara:strand:- start:6 stop:725 length:720 start_codon:yes stop_codon:yes gene_type:complete
MTDDLGTLTTFSPDLPGRPLMGMTVLVVEDSRFASEAMRLLCLRSGARIRRADCLRSARRHLQVYRPTAVIVDLGLPDGAGDGLIAELAQATPRVGVILATSGDDGAQARARAAGADGFLAKPIASLAAFQQAILAPLPEAAGGRALRALPDEEIHPDTFAFRDDMIHAADLLTEGADAQTLDYLAQFLAGVARSARDAPLEQAAAGLADRRAQGMAAEAALARVSGLVQARISTAAPI